MASLKQTLSILVSDVLEECGYDRKYGVVTVSNRPDLAQFQCNAPLAAAKEYGKNPREIAAEIVERLGAEESVASADIGGPGFINLTLADGYIAEWVSRMASERLGVDVPEQLLRIVVDYGGANIAKPLHVGHLRAAIIGETIKRIARFLGHGVTGDVHLGDWGLQMGMVISEILREHPDSPFASGDPNTELPEESPVTAEDLDRIYPAASARCKEDEAALEEARRITFELQRGHAGYYALWKRIHDVSVTDLRADYERLGIEFDLWRGESDSQPAIPELVERLSSAGHAVESRDALVVFVDEPDDTRDLPPLILRKADGAYLYGTTDLATIDQRMDEFDPDLILYVVDKRQSDHFLQVFRAARKTGIAPEDSVKLEHIGFGTMNGKDGKPFKTRTGGVMKLKDLIHMLVESALERMRSAEVARGYSDEEKTAIAEQVGIAALKFGDLSNQPSKDYVFDLERFASFEGKTGPYVLYTAVRIKSILRKAAERGIEIGPLGPPANDAERAIMLRLAALPEALGSAFDNRAPHILCDYVYELSSSFSAFYHDHHILNQEDQAQRASWLELSQTLLSTIESVSGLLGFEIPERM